MGVHFDTLIDIVKRPNLLEPALRHRVQDLIDKAGLVELPIDSRDLPEQANLALSDFRDYVRDHFEISKQSGVFLARPFEITAVEDLDSVVLMENVGENHFFVVNVSAESKKVSESLFYAGDVEIGWPSQNGLPIAVHADRGTFAYDYSVIPVHESIRGCYSFGQDLGLACSAAVFEIVYIMDPSNSIVQKESNASVRQSRKKSKDKKMRKTIMRPHYVCLPEGEVREFLESENPEGRYFEVVAGHFKKLRSERFRYKRGEKLYIAQYHRGEEEVQGRDGFNYRPMIKETPTRVVPVRGK